VGKVFANACNVVLQACLILQPPESWCSPGKRAAHLTAGRPFACKEGHLAHKLIFSTRSVQQCFRTYALVAEVLGELRANRVARRWVSCAGVIRQAVANMNLCTQIVNAVLVLIFYC